MKRKHTYQSKVSRLFSSHSMMAPLLLVLGVTLPSCGGHNTSPNQAADASGGTSSALPPDTATIDASIPLVVAPTAPDVPPCTRPFAPVLETVPGNAVLPVFASAADALEVATAEPTDAGIVWSSADSITLPQGPSELSIMARLQNHSCVAAKEFAHTYSVRDTFAPAVGEAGSTAIASTDAQFTTWATRVIDYQRGENLSDEWANPERALGQAGNDTTAVVSLGEGGAITLGFDTALADGNGYDFAVFENGFGDEYLELAFIEVSSDGVNFVRFDAATLVSAPVGAYGTMAPTQLQGFAGKYRVGWGTPFDLAWLSARPEVEQGLVDLGHITAIRVVDIVGDGRVRDSLGHVVYDPYPTTGSAGFDLDAIGLIHVNP